jgi:hypothetical protein
MDIVLSSDCFQNPAWCVYLDLVDALSTIPLVCLSWHPYGPSLLPRFVTGLALGASELLVIFAVAFVNDMEVSFASLLMDHLHCWFYYRSNICALVLADVLLKELPK